MKFTIRLDNFPKILLAEIVFERGDWVVKRDKHAQSIGLHIPESNEGDLCRCAEFLAAETAAISARCNGYLVVKEA